MSSATKPRISPRVLCINPGSTSTKLAVFEGDKLLFSEEARHPKDDLNACCGIQAQLPMRRMAVEQALFRHGCCTAFDAVAGRGGLLQPLPGGVYAVDDIMLDELSRNAHGEHPCNLGAPLALLFAQASGCPAYVVDPPVTDELRDIARITGLPRIRRRTVFHALSQRMAARLAAEQVGVRYEDAKFVVAHLGGGVSVGAHDRGQVVDVTNGLDGEGPMSAERAGSLPALVLVEMVQKGADPALLRREILTAGGLYAHTGTNDLREVEERFRAGEAHCGEAIQALAYGVAKSIGGMAAALFEETADGLAAVVLTGGMARSEYLAGEIARRVRFLAPVLALPQVDELLALSRGAQLALAGRETIRSYAALVKGKVE
ncbi:MAG: butyrate kinase [Humidesulfovibrio sp.]|uniref:butyrate kinase n=1 Tax=Humidesulfovibrio sp. TaxID=2910988 RepID=UPI0027339E36|nr:butyrate kinase [Humidesulfovibrio sp.]MDP2848262.1 butyrate kinase [Humidesulfovibrio sp.]